MSVHQDGATCPGCETKLHEAHPSLVGWFHRVKAKYINAHVAWAFRDREQQNQCVLDGKSTFPWPKSEHNVTVGGKPCSRALDLFQIDEDGVARWAPGFFVQLNQDNVAAKEPILWGGRWKTLGDRDHFSLDPAKQKEWSA